MKEFAPCGSKFFHFRIDPFSEGSKSNFDRVASPECVSVPLNQSRYSTTIIDFIQSEYF